MVFTVSLLGAKQYGDSVENKPASLLVVSLGKTLNGMPPSLCGRQMVGPSSLPVVVAPVQLKTCKQSVSANAVWSIYTSSCIMLTSNSSNEEKIEVMFDTFFDLWYKKFIFEYVDEAQRYRKLISSSRQ